VVEAAANQPVAMETMAWQNSHISSSDMAGGVQPYVYYLAVRRLLSGSAKGWHNRFARMLVLAVGLISSASRQCTTFSGALACLRKWCFATTF
jgi:hypothetical protein